MKKEYIYSVVFVFLLSAVLTTILAGANAFFLPQIERNEELAQKRAVLYVLNIPFQTDADVEQAFAEQIRTASVDGIDLFVQYDQSQVTTGYAVPFQGSGLWGLIRGYMGLSSDLDGLLGVEFTEHNETPGLGSRIDEEWYKEQYRNIPIEDGQPVLTDDDGDRKIDSITGATSTSNAVIDIIGRSASNAVETLEGEL